MPKRPVRRTRDLARGDFRDHGQDTVGDVVELDALVQVLRERLVHDRNRADASHRFFEGLTAAVGLDAPGLETEQGRHRLEVVLDPVVDLPDRRVLGDQLAFAAAEFGDVTEQDQRADAGALGAEGDRAELDDPVAGLDLELARRPAAGDLGERLVHRSPGRGEFGGGPAQVLAD